MKIAIYKDTFANNRGADIAVKNLAFGTNESIDLAKVDGLPPIVQQFHTDPAYPFRHWIKHWRRNRAIKAALKKAAAFQVLSSSHVCKLQKYIYCSFGASCGTGMSYRRVNQVAFNCENCVRLRV